MDVQSLIELLEPYKDKQMAKDYKIEIEDDCGIPIYYRAQKNYKDTLFKKGTLLLYMAYL